MEKLLSLVPNEAVTGSGESGFHKTRAKGAGLRQLQILLTELDRSRHWGGLERALAKTGDFLWLCPGHFGIFEPGLPRLD